MKSDDLERLEESQEMQQLIHAAKEQYEQEKSVHPPVAYAAFAQNLRERQKDGKMKAKQEPPERETFEVKGGKRSGISPWWLVAACLLGGIIGYGISTTSAGSWFGETCCSRYGDCRTRAGGYCLSGGGSSVSAFGSFTVNGKVQKYGTYEGTC